MELVLRNVNYTVLRPVFLSGSASILEACLGTCNNPCSHNIAYTGLSQRCLVWPEAEMSRMARDGDVLYGREWRCLVRLETMISCMAGDDC